MSIDAASLPGILSRFRSEIAKKVVGQEGVLDLVLTALFCRGHVLLVGAPGLAKTTLVNSFASALDLNFNRIQFTPDLMPSDITGSEILQENKSTGTRELIFTRGPIFTQILLADEINRTPPKTQAALLQAMQEKKVTVFGKTETLVEPFMVLATQNPIEQEGTYPLPEAQLDRFVFSIWLDYPSFQEELDIVQLTTSTNHQQISPVLSRNEIIQIQNLTYETPVPEHVAQYAVKVVRATRPTKDNPIKEIRDYVRWGAGPRATQFLLLAAKARALLQGRPLPIEEDVRQLLIPTLKHRILLNFHAEADNVDLENIISLVKNPN